MNTIASRRGYRYIARHTSAGRGRCFAPAKSMPHAPIGPVTSLHLPRAAIVCHSRAQTAWYFTHASRCELLFSGSGGGCVQYSIAVEQDAIYLIMRIAGSSRLRASGRECRTCRGCGCGRGWVVDSMVDSSLRSADLQHILGQRVAIMTLSHRLLT